jgi:hypothetical protein
MNLLLLLLSLLVFPCLTFAASVQGSVYVSEIDSDLNLKQVVLASAYDNLDGIYAKPLEEHLIHLIEEDRRFDVAQTSQTIKPVPIEDLEENPNLVKSIIGNSNSRGLIAMKITKGSQGIYVKIDFFTPDKGLLFTYSELRNFQSFELLELKNQVSILFSDLMKNFPFQGLVLSRKGALVTINIGYKHGVHTGEDLSIVQILKTERHPKFKFVVSVEKEVLGKIRITKADDNLSFGQILFEKEDNSIHPGHKVLLNFPVFYTPPVVTESGIINKTLPGTTEKNPQEWLPSPKPTFGRLELGFTLGNYQTNANLQTAGSISAASSLTTGINLETELWINPNWFLNLSTNQSILSSKNSLDGSLPSRLTFSLSKYTLEAGYNLLFSQDFFGPKVSMLLGLGSFKSSVDVSTPTAFTTSTYTGMNIGIRGSFPLPQEIPWTLGAEFFYYLSKSHTENPVTSGDLNSINMNQFSFFAKHTIRTNLNFITKINFESYQVGFANLGTRGDTAQSVSHSINNAEMGVEFLY